ncbi:hypothetical protein [Paenibacillus sp. HB172176]|uniref:ZIP family metal transporter n=1 Tax=Paenibacillus sp. HB172176 TaxID=2493690 RepID=UPI00143C6BED|nr:hypothetical protein [Paenibacillus sp. HB172176]
MAAIPESVMIGSSLLGGGKVSWLLVIAIFLSNIPEGLSSTVGLRKNGFSKMKLSLMWISILVISTLAAMTGNQLLADSPDHVMVYMASFTGGGIIAMLSSTMMPEAYEEGGPFIGLVASCGLLASLMLDHLN